MLSDYIWLFLTLLIILIMIFGNRKVRIISVFAMQFQGFKNARNNKISLWDIVCFLFMPVVLAAIITYKFQIIMDDTLAQVFTTIFSLAFTVLFGFAAILVGKIDSKHDIEKRVVGETFVSIVSATLLCLISTILSIITIRVNNFTILSLLSFAVYSISFMIVMLMLLITKRTFIIYCNATNENKQ